MARTGITYEEIELTAEHLLQEGVDPTIERIRFMLGTGSNTTISKYLKEWRSKRLASRPEILPSLKTPPDPVNQAVARVWQQLQEENDTKIKEIESAAQQRIDEAQAAKVLALEERDRLIADSQDLRALLKEARQYNAELEQKKIDMNQAYAAMEAKLQTMAEAYQAFKQMAETKLEKLQQSHGETIQKYQQEIEKIEQNKNDLIANIKDNAENNRHQYIVENEHLKTANSHLQKQQQDKDKVLNVLTDKITELEKELITNRNMVNKLPDLFDNYKIVINESFTTKFSEMEDLFAKKLIDKYIKAVKLGNKKHERIT